MVRYGHSEHSRNQLFLHGAGVNGRGLPEMQAQLYKLEQAAAVKKAAGESLTKPRRAAGLGKANRGVAERDQLDRLLAPVGLLELVLGPR